MTRKLKLRNILVALAFSVAGLAFSATSAEGHGYRHGKSLSAQEIKLRPSWLMAPGHTCNRDFVGDIAVTYDEQLGWVIIWKCTCKPHPNGVTFICWWKPIRVLPENVSNKNKRILREMREVMKGHSYTRPRFRELPGGVVFRRHAIDDNCHWHNPRPATVIWASRL